MIPQIGQHLGDGYFEIASLHRDDIVQTLKSMGKSIDPLVLTDEVMEAICIRLNSRYTFSTMWEDLMTLLRTDYADQLQDESPDV